MVKRKRSNRDRAISPVVGTILMVAIAILLASALYVMVVTMSGTPPQRTQKFITFYQERFEGKLRVIYAGGGGLQWSNLIVSPITVEKNDTNKDGYINAGEYLCNCTGKTVTVTWEPTNTLLGTWDFT
ncbi:MAG TPA: type IV pilin [Thermoplasmata archaeon]|nr:type IV pilin [Thermoplasmata archaeon]